MRKVLIPVDGSRRSDIAVECVVRQARLGQIGRIHLLNVQPEFGGYIARFISRSERDAFRRELGQEALAGARRRLDDAGLAYTVHIRVGEVIETVAQAAEELAVGEIVVGADSFGPIGAIEVRSFVDRLIRRSSVPVSVVKHPVADMNFNRATGSWWLRPSP
jgi:nucleotide-binding universal stress UspA family protein